MKRWYIIAGFVVSLLLIGWLLWGVERDQVRLAFAQVRLTWVGAISAIVVCHISIHAWRWTFLLRPVHPLGFGLCFRATGVGFLSNLLLPAHAGSVVRALVAGKGGRVPVGSVFATLILERIIATLILLPLLFLALVWVEPPLLGTATKASLRVGLWLSGAGVMFLGLVLGGLIWAHQRTLAILYQGLAFLPSTWMEKIIGWADSFVRGLQGLPTGMNLVFFIALSVAIWGCWFAGNLCLIWAFDLALPFSAPLMLMLLQFLGFSLPGGPGVLGTYHIAATMSGLLLYGLPSAIAFSAAIVLQVVISGIAIFVGLNCLLAESMLSRRPQKFPARVHADVEPSHEGWR